MRASLLFPRFVRARTAVEGPLFDLRIAESYIQERFFDSVSRRFAQNQSAGHSARNDAPSTRSPWTIFLYTNNHLREFSPRCKDSPRILGLRPRGTPRLAPCTQSRRPYVKWCRMAPPQSPRDELFGGCEYDALDPILLFRSFATWERQISRLAAFQFSPFEISFAILAALALMLSPQAASHNTAAEAATQAAADTSVAEAAAMRGRRRPPVSAQSGHSWRRLARILRSSRLQRAAQRA